MKIALGVSGGIAAYKAAEIVRLLQDRGIRVQVVMTRAAQEFVRPLTFAALSGEKVITDLFGSSSEDAQANVESAIEHIAIAQAIDALVVVPATADVLAKFAQGIANDFLSTLYLATTAPVVVAPAMNVNMWNHAATQSNVGILRKRGVRIVEPGSGYLACGMTGAGRLAENETIVAAVMEALGATQDLAGETVLVTAGPTREKIDPVRYLTNRSSGRMGYAIAEAALRRGARVLLVSGPTAIAAPDAAETTRVETAEEMLAAVVKLLPESTVIIKTAAVADFQAESGGGAEDQAHRRDDAGTGTDRGHSGGSGAAEDFPGGRGICRRDRERAGKRTQEAGLEVARCYRGERRFARGRWFRLRPQRGHHHLAQRSRRGSRDFEVGSCAPRARPSCKAAETQRRAVPAIKSATRHGDTEKNKAFFF